MLDSIEEKSPRGHLGDRLKSRPNNFRLDPDNDAVLVGALVSVPDAVPDAVPDNDTDTVLVPAPVNDPSSGHNPVQGHPEPNTRPWADPLLGSPSLPDNDTDPGTVLRSDRGVVVVGAVSIPD